MVTIAVLGAGVTFFVQLGGIISDGIEVNTLLHLKACVSNFGQYTGDANYASNLDNACHSSSHDCKCFSSASHKCQYFDGGIAAKSCENVFNPYAQELLAVLIFDGIAIFATVVLALYQLTVLACLVDGGHTGHSPPSPSAISNQNTGTNSGAQMRNMVPRSGIYAAQGYPGYAPTLVTSSAPSAPVGYVPVSSAPYPVSVGVPLQQYVDPSAPPIMAEATLAQHSSGVIAMATVVEVQAHQV
jgi:hypothetical protein